MKNTKIIVSILVLFISIFCSCSIDDNMIKILNNNDSFYNYLDENNQIVKYSDIEEYLFKSPNINQFNRKFHVNLYKKFNDYYYTVAETDRGLVFIFFYYNETYAGYMIPKFSDASIEDDLKKLSIGMSFEKVKAIDPNGEYPFLYSGRENFSHTSYHFISSGNVYIINYDAEFFISSIERCLL